MIHSCPSIYVGGHIGPGYRVDQLSLFLSPSFTHYAHRRRTRHPLATSPLFRTFTLCSPLNCRTTTQRRPYSRRWVDKSTTCVWLTMKSYFEFTTRHFLFCRSLLPGVLLVVRSIREIFPDWFVQRLKTSLVRFGLSLTYTSQFRNKLLESCMEQQKIAWKRRTAPRPMDWD